jgi:pimeloyl-ACP methyl ester carboxylesterase
VQKSPRLLRTLSRLFAALFLNALALRAAAPVTIETGEIAGAKFTVAVPRAWNHRLLLLAHGLRDADRPLVADLFPDHLAYRTLLEEGWIVAKTSYRRNGLIVADAIADLDSLRTHIEQKFGSLDRVLVEGESMGGLIATLIAEREAAPDDLGHPRYAGAVAIGAALALQENGATVGVSLQPRIPLLFLTNQSELNAPRGYVTANVPRDDPALRPILFRVSRDGHVNVNQRERLAALRAVNAWLDRGRDTLPAPADGAPFFDATVPPAPLSSQVIAHADGRGFDARVVEVSGNYGNVFLNVQPSDLAALHVATNQYFHLTAHGQTFRVRLGTDFGSVKRGEWVLFPNADGFTWLARNYGDAAATASLKVGDTVSIQLFDETK